MLSVAVVMTMAETQTVGAQMASAQVAGAQVTGAQVASTQSALPQATMSADSDSVSDSVRGRPLSLDEAVRAARGESKTVRIARNAVTRARGQQYQARSALFPQVNAAGNYTRTLKSQYSGVFSGGSDTSTAPAGPSGPCEQYLLTPSAPTDDRVAGLEQYARCLSAGNGSSTGGLNFGSLPFGQANAYSIGLTGTQNLFTGGRISGQVAAATAGRHAAEIELTAQQAQLTLDVTQAYYDAALSDRLLAIARATLAQTEESLRQTRLQQQVGNTSEFDLLRATVARDNQLPQVLQRESDRDVAYLRLKQLLDFPLDEPLRLTTSIEDSAAAPAGVDLSRAAHPDTVTDHRAAVREAEASIEAERGLLRVARSQRIPTIQLSSQYGGVAYPTGGIPGPSDFRANWTVTLATSFPIFAGGRIRGDELVAQANLRDARERSAQTRQYAALDARVALSALRQAEATFAASRGTATQAQRAYQIAQLRHQQGISTQLELDDARNQLSQALANQAFAARNLLVARVKLALLPDLPLQSSAAGQGMTQGGQGSATTAGAGMSSSSSSQSQSSTSQQTSGTLGGGTTGVPSF